MRRHRPQRILVGITVFVLLFAVVGLSTLAKQGKYLPKLNPLRHYSKAAKMELAHHPVGFIPVSAQPVSRILPPQPEFSAALIVRPGSTFRRTSLTISFQLRAPPYWFA